MTDTQSQVARDERRRLLLASLAGSTLALFSPGSADAAQGGDVSNTVRIVNDFCASVSKLDPAALRRFFADDVVYRMTETTPPIVGADAVMGTYQKLEAKSIEFQVLETFASGPIVINRRIDRFVTPRPFTWEGVGVFFIKDGKIKEWSDYTIRMQQG
jgi:limonene-1,2-epoxide hydrolase